MSLFKTMFADFHNAGNSSWCDDDDDDYDDFDHYISNDDHFIIIIYCFLGNKKHHLMDQREQILIKFDITIETLLEYYTSRLRKSIYKSLMRKCLNELNFDESLISSIIIDEKTTRKDLSLYGTDYTEQTKNFKDYKNKDRHVRRTLVSFQNNMFPGVRIDPRGGHNSKGKSTTSWIP